MESKPKAYYNDEKGNKKEHEVFWEDDGQYWYYFDQNDNIRFQYDKATMAWFPMFDESLVSLQQSVYDMGDEKKEEIEISKPTPKPNKKNNKIKSRDREEDTPKVAKPRINSSVYVSGLPLDTTVEEVKEVFGKCGLFMEDVTTGEPKIKLYKDEKGNNKGDALITYFKEESVQLAIDLLHESKFRYEDKGLISVQKAEFKEKDSSKEENRHKIDSKILKKRRQQMEKKLDWFDKTDQPENSRFKKMVLLKHMFHPKELEKDPTLLLDLKEDIREECAKVGEVTNIVLYDKSEVGACTIKFKDELSAAACIKLMDQRFFAGRRVEASIYDGTKYEKSSSHVIDEEEEKRRLESFAKWIENE